MTSPSYSSPASPDLTRSFVISQADSTGEFYILTRDGRKLTGQNVTQVAIDNGARAITGPGGHAHLIFPDGSAFTLGPGSELVLDTFVYDPNTTAMNYYAAIVKGVFRWVSASSRTRYVPRVRTPVGTIGGIRGTEFECAASPDGSGYIKLFSGEIEFAAYDTGTIIELTAGQMITYTDFKNISGPVPIE